MAQKGTVFVSHLGNVGVGTLNIGNEGADF